MPQQVPQSAVSAPAPRRPWTTPRVDDMPRLTALTLQTGPFDPGVLGDCDAGNSSSCFG